jgi:hypothetical protein
VAEPQFHLIEAYLGTLHASLGERTPGRERIVSEAEDHLRAATAQAMADGMSVEVAQRQAIARFGAPDAVAAAFLRIYGLPRVFDARGGLPAPVVDELQRTACIVLAPLNEWLAVLGYWVREDETERFGAILVRSFSQLPVGLEPVLLDGLDRIQEWQTGLVENLRPGMHLQTQYWDGEWRLWYDVASTSESRPRLEEAIAARSMRLHLDRLHVRQPLRCVRVTRRRSQRRSAEEPDAG